MKIKRLSMRALSCLLSILMLTGCLALPMSVSAASNKIYVASDNRIGKEDKNLKFSQNIASITHAGIGASNGYNVSYIEAGTYYDFTVKVNDGYALTQVWKNELNMNYSNTSITYDTSKHIKLDASDYTITETGDNTYNVRVLVERYYTTNTGTLCFFFKAEQRKFTINKKYYDEHGKLISTSKYNNGYGKDSVTSYNLTESMGSQFLDRETGYYYKPTKVLGGENYTVLNATAGTYKVERTVLGEDRSQAISGSITVNVLVEPIMVEYTLAQDDEDLGDIYLTVHGVDRGKVQFDDDGLYKETVWKGESIGLRSEVKNTDCASFYRWMIVYKYTGSSSSNTDYNSSVSNYRLIYDTTTFTPTYTKKSYTVSLSEAGDVKGGKFVVGGKTVNSFTAEYGSNVEITYNPPTGITKWYWDDTGLKESPRTVTVTGAATYKTLAFDKQSFNVTVNGSTNSTVKFVADDSTGVTTTKSDIEKGFTYNVTCDLAKVESVTVEFTPNELVDSWRWFDDPEGTKRTTSDSRKVSMSDAQDIEIIVTNKTKNISIRQGSYYNSTADPGQYEVGVHNTIEILPNTASNLVVRNFLIKVGDETLPDIYRSEVVYDGTTGRESYYLKFDPKNSSGEWWTEDIEVIPLLDLRRDLYPGSVFETAENLIDISATQTDEYYQGYFKLGEDFSFYLNPDERLLPELYENSLIPKESLIIKYDAFDDDKSAELMNNFKYEVVDVEVGGNVVKKAKVTIPAKYAQYLIYMSPKNSTVEVADDLKDILDIEAKSNNHSTGTIHTDGTQMSICLTVGDYMSSSYRSSLLPYDVVIKTKDGKVIPEDKYMYDRFTGEIFFNDNGSDYYDDILLYSDIVVDTEASVYVHNEMPARSYTGYLVSSKDDTVPNKYLVDSISDGDFSEQLESSAVPYGKDITIKYDGNGRFPSWYTLYLDITNRDDVAYDREHSYVHAQVYGSELNSGGTTSLASWYDAEAKTITIPGKYVIGRNLSIIERNGTFHSTIAGTLNSYEKFYEGQRGFGIFSVSGATLPELEYINVYLNGRLMTKDVDYTITKSGYINFITEDYPYSEIEVSTPRTYNIYVYDRDTKKCTLLDNSTLYHNNKVEKYFWELGLGYRPHIIGVGLGVVENGKIVEDRGTLKCYDEIFNGEYTVYENFMTTYNNGIGNDCYWSYNSNKLYIQAYAVHGDIILYPGGSSGSGSGSGDYHEGTLKHFTKTYGDCVNGYKVLDYWYCEGCDEYFSDKYGSNVINPDSYIYYPHELVPVDAQDGEDCQHDGILAHYECTKCHDTFYDPDANQKMPNPGKHKYAPYWVWEKKGDTYEYNFTLENRCSLCGHIEETVKANDVTYDKDDKGNVTAHAKAVLFGKTYTLDHTYNVGLTFAVENGTIVSGKKDSNYTASDRIQVEADAAPSGKVFDGWYEGDTKIASTEVFDYFIDHNAVITAKYTDSKPVTTNPVEYSIINNGRNWYNKAAGTTSAKLTFRYNLTEYLNGKHYYIKEAGILRSYTVDEPSFDNYDNSTVVKKVASTNKFNFTFNYTLNMGASKKTSNVYMRGYIKYVDFNTGKEFIAYTDVTKFNAMS